MKSIFRSLLAAALLALPGSILADDSLRPDILQVTVDGPSGSFYNLSDNGKWIVGHGMNEVRPDLWGGSVLINSETGETIPLVPESDPNVICAANDVADNGDVFGVYEGLAAVWRKATGKWTVLPTPPVQTSFEETDLVACTADGRYAVGMAWSHDPIEPWQDFFNLKAIAYKFDDEGNATLIDLKNNYTGFTKVLPGGLVPVPEGLYNLETGEVTPLPAEHGVFSPNGKLMLSAENYDESSGTISGKMTLHNLETGTSTEIEDNSPANSIQIVAISDNGMIFGSYESSLMFRNWYVHIGKYWYDLRLILQGAYGIDWKNEYSMTDNALTGTFWGTSADASVQITMDNTKTPWQGYIWRWKESFGDMAKRIDLLTNRHIFPADGASFSRLSNISITFDRPVEALVDADKINVLDPEGNVVRNAIRFGVSPSDQSLMEISFRNYTLEEGKTYTVVIPAGAISVAGDHDRTNSEIRLNYTGRPNQPVAVTKVAPEQGNSIPSLSMSSNPVTVVFDANLSVVENSDNVAKINLYKVSEEGDELMTPLSAQVNGSTVTIYPVLEQRLQKGRDYKIVISANTFADLSGANPNEEYVINYHGSYVLQADPTPFADNFDAGIDGSKWLFFDNDNNEPAAIPASWGFTAEYPWYMIKESNEQVGWTAVSHSMYSPAGKSDDWMVIRPIYIADDTYTLSFLSQSYLEGKEDRLQVYVWPSEEIFSQLSTSIIDKMRWEGTKVYDEIQSPGATQEGLSGEWTENEVSLADFAGKFIYVAFVNENNNQSAIFLDDVAIGRELTLSLMSTTETTNIGEKSAKVSGTVSNMSPNEAKGIELVLLDGNGNEIDRLVDDVTLPSGETYDFTFSKELPLVIGENNLYRIQLKSGDINTSVSGSIKSLMFSTTRRVFLEENTGTNCGFCPQGHTVIERLEKDFGDRIIPMGIHGYTGGSMFSTDFSMAYAQFLGMNGAPQGAIDRLGIYAPMGQGFKIIAPEGGVWYDVVAKRLGEFADADVTINNFSYTADKLSIQAEVKYAFNTSDMNLNILTAVLEDNLKGRQSNYFGSYEEAAAGDMTDWINGHIYGDDLVSYNFTNVVRALENETAFNGVGGYLPSTIEGGKPYAVNVEMDMPKNIKNMDNVFVVMAVIDANTGRIVNAASNKETTGVESVADELSDVKARSIDGRIVVSCDGDFNAGVYGIDGMLLASAAGRDAATFDMNGKKGIVIVRVTKDGKATNIKLAL